MLEERSGTGSLVVVAGTGGNGGGGICAARHLADHGVDVTVVVSDLARLTPVPIGWMSEASVPVVALDVPSGIDASTGQSPGSHVRASATLSIALPKTGLHVDAVGDLWVADIGIPGGVFERAGVERPPAGLFVQGWARRLAHHLER